MMMASNDPKRHAAEILGVEPGSSAETLRAAYLARIKEHPPDRDPEQFERIRDAYQTLSRLGAHAGSQLDPSVMLGDLIQGEQRSRTYVNAKVWLAAIRACCTDNDS